MSNRPLSPHLQIYRPQLTSVLSITHRATGFVLSVGTLFITWWLISLITPYYGYFDAWVHSGLGQIMLLGWVACFYYHLLNGVRHLLWDIGWGLDLPTATKTGWAVVIFTFILTFFTWSMH